MAPSTSCIASAESKDSPSGVVPSASPEAGSFAVVSTPEINVERHCYLQSFSAADFPWPTAACLNLEEVFKNYQFLEAKWDPLNLRLVVTQYRVGVVESVQTYVYDKRQARLRQTD